MFSQAAVKCYGQKKRTLAIKACSSCPFLSKLRGSSSSLSAASRSLPSGANDLSSSATVSMLMCLAASANCFFLILLSSWKMLSELSPVSARKPYNSWLAKSQGYYYYAEGCSMKEYPARLTKSLHFPLQHLVCLFEGGIDDSQSLVVIRGSQFRCRRNVEASTVALAIDTALMMAGKQ